MNRINSTFQPHLPSLFDAMYTVNFDEKDRIYAMNSDNGETIDFDKIVTCIGGVEASLVLSERLL